MASTAEDTKKTKTYLPPENHARPGVSRESLRGRYSDELVVIGYNQKLLGAVVLDVVPGHLRALSFLVLCGSTGDGTAKRKRCVLWRGLQKPSTQQTMRNIYLVL